MRKTHLAAFVHGWGAHQPDWWGVTPAALASHTDFASVEFYFHRFETQHGPQLRWVSRVAQLLGSPRHQVLGELGQHLWTILKRRNEREAYETIAIFGHSFGGLVVADAISYAHQRATQGSQEDALLLSKISALGLCCAPLGGAKLATMYTAAIKIVGHNPHVQNLLVDDLSRRNAVNNFINFISSKSEIVTTFRAVGDGIVGPNELNGPFRSAGLTVNEYVLDGTHSDCVQNIGLAEAKRKDNFDCIANWLRKSIMNPPNMPRDLRESFEELINKLRSELREQPLRSWRELRGNSEVTDNYLLRLFLQRLIYAAAHIDRASLGSANLWVAHHDRRGKIHLRSEEREGYFTTRQLIVFSGEFMPGENRVTIRANQVHDAREDEDMNSAGALAFLHGKGQLIGTDRTGFPSEIDRQTGVTHILGIPLYSKSDLRDLSPEDVDGAPLAITIDFNFKAVPSEADEGALLTAARNVTEIFGILHSMWLPGGVRIKLQ